MLVLGWVDAGGEPCRLAGPAGRCRGAAAGEVVLEGQGGASGPAFGEGGAAHAAAAAGAGAGSGGACGSSCCRCCQALRDPVLPDHVELLVLACTSAVSGSGHAGTGGGLLPAGQRPIRQSFQDAPHAVAQCVQQQRPPPAVARVHWLQPSAFFIKGCATASACPSCEGVVWGAAHTHTYTHTTGSCGGICCSEKG